MSYQSPGPGDERVDWILTEINTAQQTLDARIAEARALPQTEPSRAARIARLNAMKREVDTAYGDLDSSVATWADRDISNFYRRGHLTAASQLGAGYSFTLPHREALELISFDAYDDVGTRLQQTRDGFSANVELQKAFESLDPAQIAALRSQSRSAVNQMLLTGEDPRKISKRLADDLWADGIKIIDSSGRQWNTESYTRMLVRTKSANAYNAGSMNKYAEEGVSRVKVFDGVQDDEACADANGEIWTLDYAMEHVIEHPNCRRAFGPLQGEGPVDKENDVSKLVLFDRLETAAVALTALRAFRRTGEINVSSTLARLVIETIETVSGVPLPLVDTFVMNAVGQGFRNIDQHVESYLDPILFAAGFIDEIPLRAQVLATTDTNPNVLRNAANRLAEAIGRSRFNEVGKRSRVGAVLTKLDEVADQADAVVRRFDADNIESDSVRYLVDQLNQVGRFGQIVGETIVILNRGEITDLKSAWLEAVDYVDGIRALRVSQLRILMENHDVAVQEMNTYVTARRVTQRLLQLEELPDEIPEQLRPLLEQFQVSFELGSRTTRAHLEALDERLEQLHWLAFKRASQTRDLAKKLDSRLLPYESIGPDLATESANYWSDPQFVAAADEFINTMSQAYVSVVRSRADIDAIAEGGFVMYRIARSEEGAQALFTQLAISQGYTRPVVPGGPAIFVSNEVAREILTKRFLELDETSVVRSLLIEGGALKEADPDFLDVQKLFRVIGDELSELTFDGPNAQVLWKQAPIDGLKSFEISELARLTSGVFGARIADDYPLEMTALLRRVSGNDPADVIGTYWNATVRVASPEAFTEVAGARPQDFEKILKSAFPGRIVKEIKDVDAGVNGATYVLEMSNGQKVFVKRFSYDQGVRGGGLQGAPESPVSQILSSLVGRELGLEIPPSKLFAMPDGSVFGVAMPGLDTAEGVIDHLDDFTAVHARKHAFFDMFTGELDGHSNNYMIDPNTGVVFHIDTEAGFFWKSTDLDQINRGLSTSRAYRTRNSLLKSAWRDGDDLTTNGIDPSVKLIPLDKSEVPPGSGSFEALPLTVDKDLNTYLVAGRSGYREISSRSFSAPPGRAWEPTIFLTDSELRMVTMPLDERIDLFAREIRDQLDDLPEDLVDEWASNWAVRQGEKGLGSLDELVEWMSVKAANSVETRMEAFVNNGLINITGGIQEYTNDSGLRAVVGETIRFIDSNGEEQFGTVVNLIERLDGSIHAQIANKVGFGLPSDEFRGIQRMIDVDLNDFALPVPEGDELVFDYITEVRRRLDAAADGVTTSDPSLVPIFEINADGVLAPTRYDSLMIENFAENQGEVLRVRGGPRGNLLSRVGLDELTAQELTDIVNEEIQFVAGANRPVRIIISPNSLQTADGKRALGLFDADTRTLFVSATGLFEGVKADDLGRIIFDNPQQLHQLADYDTFRLVVRHELGHAQVIGRELEFRSRISQRILQQILNQNPDLRTADDLEAFARSQLRLVGREGLVGADESAMEALVRFRTSLMEDLVHSNRIQAAKEIVSHENFPSSKFSPVIRNRLKRGDEDAYHELLADIFTEVGNARTYGVINGLDLDAMFVLDNFIEELPVRWDGSEFTSFVQRQLRENAVLTQIDRNNTRAFWKEVDFDTDVLVKQARVPYGGFTFDVVSETQPPHGWAVAIEKNERRLKNFSEKTDEEVAEFIAQYREDFAGTLDQQDWFLGGWHNTDEDVFVLDTSRVFSDEVSAARFGFAENQEEMIDLGSLRESPGDPTFKNLVTEYKDIDEYIDAELPEFRVVQEDIIDVLAKKIQTQQTFDPDELGRYPTLSLDSLKTEKLREKWQINYDTKTIFNTETRRKIDVSKDSLKARLREVLERAEDELIADPEYRERIRFYRTWNQGYRDLSVEKDVPFRRIAAAAAAMSPGLDAEVNYDAALWVTRTIADDPPLTQKQVKIIKEYYADLAERYKGEYALDKGTEAGRLASIARGEEFESWISTVKVGDRISEKSADEAQKMLHVLRKMEFADEALRLEVNSELPRTWDTWDDLFKIQRNDGLPGMNADSYVKGIRVLRGELDALDVLGEPKVRSFYNNIVDPLNLVGMGDVTVDFHMVDAALRGNSERLANVKNIYGSPPINGLQGGIRVTISDAVRELFEEGWDFKVDAASPAELQEVIWGVWKRGKEEGWWGEIPIVRQIQ